jgi:hypothetical protein
MADEAVLAIEDFPTVTALGLSVLELGLVEGLDILVAKLGPTAAVGGEGNDGEEDASGVNGELVVLAVLGGLCFFGAAGVARSGSGCNTPKD